MIASMIEFIARALGDRQANKTKRINLALQGGGAHGAFTWGVLDHLLEDGRLTIEGISGTSAGAVNAVMLADGLRRGGPDEARKRLAEFWRAASLGGDLPAVQRAVTDRLFSLLPIEGSPTLNWMYGLVAISVALRSQPAQHQSAQGPGRALRRFRRPARRQAADLHRRHQCADRPAAYFSARKDFRRSRDGIGLPAGGVPRGRDRRRALLGRRLSRQSGALSVLPLDRHRGRGDRPDQSAGAQENAALDARDHGPRQRDHLQLVADGGIARHRIRQPADRTGPPAARHRRRTNIASIKVHRIVLEGLGERFSSASKLRNDYESFELAAQARPARGAALPRRALRRYRRARAASISSPRCIRSAARLSAPHPAARSSFPGPASPPDRSSSTSGSWPGTMCWREVASF